VERRVPCSFLLWSPLVSTLSGVLHAVVGAVLCIPRPVPEKLWKKTKWSEAAVTSMIRSKHVAPLVAAADDDDNDSEECPICCIVRGFPARISASFVLLTAHFDCFCA
jgi:hypothetical protein